MRHVLLALSVVGVSLTIASESQAGIFGRLRGGNCSSGCSTSSPNSGCNISAAPPQQASAAALAQQIIEDTAGVRPQGFGAGTKTASLNPEPQAVVLDRTAAIAFCALPRDPLVIGRMASK